MDFNPIPATTMHVDINSCFASVEQQANPHLRGRPVAVAAYVKDYGCILAVSREAKVLGVKTGMRVKEGRALIPHLVVLPPDPPKYRAVNKALFTLLSSYTPYISIESIDEMVLKLSDISRQPSDIVREIKQRIKKEIGEWITVSIGIAPNRYLAKVASGLQKPDGLVMITKDNIIETFGRMKLEDFCGIKQGNAGRLRAAGIGTPLEFFQASSKELQHAFHSIAGHQWWLRLHGYDPSASFDKTQDKRSGQGTVDQKSFGQSYALGKPYGPHDPRLWQILAQLVMKMGRRLRRDGFAAYGVGVSLLFDGFTPHRHGAGYTHWHTQEKFAAAIVTDMEFYSAMRRMLERAPCRPVKLLAVYSYALTHESHPSLFPEENKKRDVSRAIDAIQDRFGDFVIHPARMLAMEQKVLDRIAFGGVK